MPKRINGIVVSDKTDKTIVVETTTRKTHPLYKKQYSVNKKFMAHDEENKAKVGYSVSIIECRPLSAKKRFKLDKILQKPPLSEENLQVIKAEDNPRPTQKSKPKEDEEVVKEKEK